MSSLQNDVKQFNIAITFATNRIRDRINIKF